MNRVFESYFDFDKLHIKWWEHIILWFLPTRVAIDTDKDSLTIMSYKVWKGKVYIMSSNTKKPPE